MFVSRTFEDGIELINLVNYFQDNSLILINFYDGTIGKLDYAEEVYVDFITNKDSWDCVSVESVFIQELYKDKYTLTITFKNKTNVDFDILTDRVFDKDKLYEISCL